MGRLRFLAPLILGTALMAALAPEARAQRYNGYQNSLGVWRSMDRCKRNAWREHPDYTPADEVARERLVKGCLAANNLPPTPSEGAEPRARSGSSR